MPGLHILISMNNDQAISREKQVFVDMLASMKHFQWYIADVLYGDSKARAIIARSHYKGYPFTILPSGKDLILIDGAVYNKSERVVKKELDKISLVEDSLSQMSEKIRKFLATTHGEFVIVKYNREIQKCLVFNDALGRLPFYYCSSCNQHPDKIVMSREMKFIIPFLEKANVDMLAFAECLLFGYPLGERTLWQGIKRLPPAAAIVVDARKEEFIVRKVLTWNLEPGSQTTNQLREETRRLVNLFLSSAENIANRFPDDYAQVVLLSGGLDSRSTLAALVRAGENPSAYLYPSRENRIARKIARTLKVKHQIARLSFETELEDYVSLTDGSIGIGLRNLLPYLYDIRKKMGNNMVLYTGDGGDKTIAPLSLSPTITNVEELLEHIIETDHIFDTDEISSMIDLPKDDFHEHLKKHIITFPEKTLEGKFIHFKVFERAFKWMFLGEDRNRLFSWSTSPFYSVDFFRASTKLSQQSKKHYVLYKNFISGLSPSLCRIIYYDRLIPLSIPNWLLKLHSLVFERFKKRFSRHARKRGATSPLDLFASRRSQEGIDGIKKIILTPLRQRSFLSFLVLSRVTEITDRATNLRKLNSLATLVVYIDHVKSHLESS